MSQKTKKIVAAFDFDKTLTDRETTLQFLLYSEGKWRTGLKILKLLPDLIGFQLGLKTRQEVKEKLLQAFFRGKSREEMNELGLKFANERIPYFIKPDGLKKLRWHQKQGHVCLLVSASIGVYLKPWAHLQKFDHLLCSELEYQNERVTGQLLGLNCWGPEKKERLLKLLGDKNEFILYAYGDSRGDQELLEIADYPFYRTFQEK